MHESVGGQECLSSKINFRLFSKSIGFKKYFEIKDTNNIEKKIQEILSYKTPTFINVLIGESDNKNLPRIKNFKKIQKNFMNYEL